MAQVIKIDIPVGTAKAFSAEAPEGEALQLTARLRWFQPKSHNGWAPLYASLQQMSYNPRTREEHWFDVEVVHEKDGVALNGGIA